MSTDRQRLEPAIGAGDPAAGTPDALFCRAVTVRHGDTRAVDKVGLTVGRGEVVALLGPSGSGKTTLLQAVAGLTAISSGEIRISGKRVADQHGAVAPELRDIGMVFQNFALWPHLNVLDTVSYPIRRAGRSARRARGDAHLLLQQLGIDHLADRRPAELSGGEQQRTGLARALARDASLYLLDEPTAHLDTHLRSAFTESVLDRQRQSGAAVLYATHDAAEALSIADRIAVMVNGRMIQCDTPVVVYEEPVDAVAARLTGPCSILSAPCAALSDGRLSVDLGGGSVIIAESWAGGAVNDTKKGYPAFDRTVARTRRLLVRPNWVREDGAVTAVVTAVSYRGAHTCYQLQCAAGTFALHRPGPPHHRTGDLVPCSIDRIWVLGTESTVPDQ